MKHYELYKCRFIIFFIVFVLSFQRVGLYDFLSFKTMIFLFFMIGSFVYMIKSILLFKENDKLKDEFYKLSFYLLSGASAYVLFQTITIIVSYVLALDIKILLYGIKNYVFLAFLIYFAMYSYRKIK